MQTLIVAPYYDSTVCIDPEATFVVCCCPDPEVSNIHDVGELLFDLLSLFRHFFFKKKNSLTGGGGNSVAVPEKKPFGQGQEKAKYVFGVCVCTFCSRSEQKQGQDHGDQLCIYAACFKMFG